MAGKTITWANDLLKLLFQSTPIANLADNAATSPLTNLYISLHTADPGVAGAQNTSEAAYTGYAREAVARSAVGWTVTGNSVSPASTIVFPAATAGSETETFWGIGVAATGAGTLLYSGPITPGLAVSNGVTPELTTSSTATES
ncbi:MAG: hypothetical protein GJU67_05625 [Ferrovum sp.]|jgi:hypothetical protein|nr:hypothetical protein [Ferrovum sp.]